MKIMYELKYIWNSSENIDKFINWYLNSFLELFENSGLESENIIKNHYIQNSIKFQEDIFYSIKNILAEANILWFKKLENWNLEITTIVWNYRLFIEYWENNDEKIRFIENIRFFYK